LAVVTVKFTPLLGPPDAVVTTTLPLVAPLGTTAVMLVLLHELTAAAVPFIVIVLEP
jgi:hypothetical protein